MNALCEAVKTYGPLAGRLLLALIATRGEVKRIKRLLQA